MTVNNQGRFRKPSNNFTMVSNNVLQDKELSLSAKGLYATIYFYISIPDFVLYKSYLQSQCCKEGKRAFDTAWNVLKASGILKVYKERNPEGWGFYYEYELLTEPQPIISGDNQQKRQIEVDIGDDYFKCLAYVNEKIEFEHWKAVMGCPYIENIRDIIVEVLTTSGNRITVGKERKNLQEVQATFKKITYSHIEYILNSLDETCGDFISSRKNYLMATIYNAVKTLEFNDNIN